MTKSILVSCFAASFLLSGAAIAPTWAVTGDQGVSVRTLFADGDQSEEAAPQDEQGGEDRDSYLIDTPSTMTLAQSEEGEAAEPKPEEGSEEGGGSD